MNKLRNEVKEELTHAGALYFNNKYYLVVRTEGLDRKSVFTLEDPTKVIAKPDGHFIAPYDDERVGDVSNVIFCNGAIVNEQDEVFIFYVSSDTRMHVATTTIKKLIDYTFNTPEDQYRSLLNAEQRKEMVEKNEKLLNSL